MKNIKIIPKKIIYCIILSLIILSAFPLTCVGATECPHGSAYHTVTYTKGESPGIMIKTTTCGPCGGVIKTEVVFVCPHDSSYHSVTYDNTTSGPYIKTTYCVLCEKVIDTVSGVRGSSSAASTSSILADFIDEIFNIIAGVGVIVLAWGGITFILSMKAEDAEAKSKAIMLIVVAIVLMCVGWFLDPIFELIGYSTH